MLSPNPGLARDYEDAMMVARRAKNFLFLLILLMLLAQIGIWQRGDISQCPEFGGDMDRALAAIRARVLLMPGQTDRYFDVRDNEAEVGRLVSAKSAELHPIPSIHGHRAGNPVSNPADRAFIHAEIAALLQS